MRVTIRRPLRKTRTCQAESVGLQGKGAFVTHAAITAWDKWLGCGLSWCALQHAWTWGSTKGPLDEDDERTRGASRLIDESLSARGRGVDPWWWAWVVPSRVDAYVDALAADLAVAGEAAPSGVILNLELAEPAGAHGRGRPAWTTGSDGAAARLMARVRDVWPGEVWVTTHGYRVARQPWAALEGADGVLPQAYNPSCSYDEGFVERCLDSYEKIFPARDARVPLLGANSTAAPCMRRYVQEAEDVHAPAVAWWSWTGLSTSTAKRAEVAACAIPRSWSDEIA